MNTAVNLSQQFPPIFRFGIKWHSMCVWLGLMTTSYFNYLIVLISQWTWPRCHILTTWNFCRRIPSGHTMGTVVTPLYVQRWSLVSNVSALSLWTPDQNHIQHPLGIGQRSSTRQWTTRERSRGTLTSDTRGHIWAETDVYDSVPMYNHLLSCDQSYFVLSHDDKWANSIHWWNVFGGSWKLVNEPLRVRICCQDPDF